MNLRELCIWTIIWLAMISVHAESYDPTNGTLTTSTITPVDRLGSQPTPGSHFTFEASFDLNTFVSDPCSETPPPDSIEVVLRVYTRAREASGSWTGLVGKLHSATIYVDTSGLPEDAMLALAGCDQDNPELARYMDNAIIFYKAACQLAAPQVPWGKPVSEWPGPPENSYFEVRLADALGQPIPTEGLRLFYVFDNPNLYRITDRPPLERARLLNLGPVKKFENGYALAPQCVSTSEHIHSRPGWNRVELGHQGIGMLLIEHPDYGRALVDLGNMHEYSRLGFILPLVHKDSPAAARALRGRIIEAGSGPVPGGAVRVRGVRTPGEGLINVHEITVLTDTQGYFRYYPIDTRREFNNPDRLVPEHSRYMLTAMSAADRRLLPNTDELNNDKPFTLELRQGDTLHQFTTEGVGDIDRQEFLDRLSLEYTQPQAKEGRESLPKWLITEGGMMPLGEYQGTYHDLRGNRIKLEPFKITPETPKVITLRAKPSLTYSGRIVDGRTGVPLPGMIALLYSGTINNDRIEDITPEEWTEIESWSVEELAEKQQTPFHRSHSFQAITRTGADGSYTLGLKPGQETHSLLVVARNWLGNTVPVHLIEPDPQNPGQVSVPDLSTFPAAYVDLKVSASKAFDQRAALNPEWNLAEENNPPWAKSLMTQNNHPILRHQRFNYSSWLQEDDEPTRVAVPADVSLTLTIDAPYDNELSALKIDRPIHLTQGEILDLGEFEMPAATAFMVQLADEFGNPLEGLPLRREIHTNHWGVVSNTDNMGMVQLFAPAGSKGRIRLDTDIHTPGSAGGHRVVHPIWDFDLGTVTGNEMPVFTYTVPADWLKAFRESYAARENKES